MPFSSSRDPTSTFWKILHFQAQVLQILVKFSSWDTNFSKKFFLRPQCQAKKMTTRDPTFENLGGTYLLNNFLSTLPGDNFPAK